MKCYTKPEKKSRKEITVGACTAIEASARTIARIGSEVADTSVKARV